MFFLVHKTAGDIGVLGTEFEQLVMEGIFCWLVGCNWPALLSHQNKSFYIMKAEQSLTFVFPGNNSTILIFDYCVYGGGDVIWTQLKLSKFLLFKIEGKKGHLPPSPEKLKFIRGPLICLS